MNLQHKLFHSLAPIVPPQLRTLIRSRLSLTEYDLARRRAENPYINESEKSYPDSPCRLGIVEDRTQYHKHYIAACQEMGVTYKVLDLLANDWHTRFRESGCDGFLIWPSSFNTTVKATFDYRLHILEKELGMTVYPTWRECWLSEHKPRLRDWLDSYAVPHPNTWVFYDKQQALAFAEEAPLPIVVKTATGASGSGVNIIRTQKQLKALIQYAFRRGLRPRSFDANDRQWAFIYIQEYLQNVEEWRMVRIGDSFFGYRKEPGPSGLHSASHAWSWLDPGAELLNLVEHITAVGGFSSMNVDVFRATDGRLLVNECQTVFGCSTPAIQMKVNDVPGRYVFENDIWKFEPGDFCRNHMCNLRIHYLCEQIGKKTA